MERKKAASHRQSQSQSLASTTQCLSQSRSSQSFTQTQSDPLSAKELEKVTNDLVVYFLMREEAKIPLKKADFTRDLGKIGTKNLNVALKDAKRILSEDFGFHLTEVEHPSNKLYFLVNKFQNSQVLKIPAVKEKHHVLLSIVLAYIFMKGGSVPDTSLWNFLIKLGILQLDERTTHPYFGDVRRIITGEYARQHYLDYRSIPNMDPPKYEFHLGHRAKLEVNFRELMKFFCDLYGEDPRKKWKSQQQEVETLEEYQKSLFFENMDVD